MVKLTSLVKIVTGIVLVGGAIVYSAIKKDETGERWKKPLTTIEISDKNYLVSLTDEFGNKTQENFRVRANLDRERNILYLSNETQDYNRQNWAGDKKLLPVHKRHTRINERFSELHILHPKKVKVLDLKQAAHLVPQYRWDTRLKHHKKHREAKMMGEGGEQIIDGLLSIINLPSTKTIGKTLEGLNKKNKKELVLDLQKDYIATTILPQVPNKIMGNIITARDYKIQFDTSEIKGEIPIYLWEKIALGDPSISNEGEFPNKFGRLENILIAFKLDNQRKSETRNPKQLEKDYNQKILFQLGEVNGNICLINEDGTGLKNLTIKNKKIVNRNPKWSPDGSKIAFESIFLSSNWDPGGTSSTKYKVCICDSNGENKKFFSGTGYSWSPNGEKILIYNHKNSFVYNITNQNSKIKKVDIKYFYGNNPILLKDKIIYTSFNRKKEDTEIYSLSLEDSKKRRITKNNIVEELYYWVPEKERILFGDRNVPITKRYYLIDINGKNIKEHKPKEIKYLRKPKKGRRLFLVEKWVYGEDNSYVGEISPNKSKIVFSGEDKEKRRVNLLYVMDINGENVKEIYWAKSPSWQPTQ